MRENPPTSEKSKGGMLKTGRAWILVLVVLVGLLASALQVQEAHALQTVTIKSDGTIDPPVAPIYTEDNATYTLTNNITSDEGVTGIVIERDNITLDGAGYTLQGLHAGQSVTGVHAASVSNVTIQHLRVVFYRIGITVSGTYNTVSENTLIANTQFGINVGGSDNTIRGNTIDAANETGYIWGQTGIIVFASKHNFITGNTITGHTLHGIHLKWWDTILESSTDNILRNNVLTGNFYNLYVETGIPADYVNDVDASNTADGKPICYWVDQHDKTVPIDAGYVALVQCSGITIRDLVLARNYHSILLISTSNSAVMNCNISQSYYAIYSGWSSDLKISGNHIVVEYSGISLRDSPHCMILENNILFDTERASQQTLYGFNMANCLNLTVSENAMLFDYATYQPRGFFVYGCSNTTIALNTIGNIKMLFQNAANISIFHNNLLWTDFQFQGTNSLLSWDDGYPSGGNYWEDFSSTDIYSGPGQNVTGSDGICDAPRTVPSSSFVDNYPLMYPTNPIQRQFYAGYGRSADLITSSRVAAFVFNATALMPYLSFNVTGLDGTVGSCAVIFPIDLMWGTFSVYLDGALLTENAGYTKSENATHWRFDINYTHSTHTILLEGTQAIPEYASHILPLAFIVTASALLVLMRMRKQPSHEN